MSFFTFPLEAFAETFLAEGALVVPEAGEALKGAAAIGSIIGGAALPSIINPNPHPMKRRSQGAPAEAPTPKHRRIHDLSSLTNSSFTTMSGEEVPVKPIPRNVAEVAPKYFTIKLPYSVIQTHTSARVATGHNMGVFRLNSVFDPDVLSGSFKQPMGRDTWAAIYKYYRVMACDFTVNFQNQQNLTETASVKNSLLVGLEWTDDTSAAGLSQSRDAFMENKHTKEGILTGRDNSPANHKALHFSYSPNTWDNHVQTVGDEARWTPIGSNPTNNHYITVRHFPITTDTTATDLIFRIDILYTVQFTELQHSVFKTTH